MLKDGFPRLSTRGDDASLLSGCSQFLHLHIFETAPREHEASLLCSIIYTCNDYFAGFVLIVSVSVSVFGAINAVISSVSPKMLVDSPTK